MVVPRTTRSWAALLAFAVFGVVLAPMAGASAPLSEEQTRPGETRESIRPGETRPGAASIADAATALFRSPCLGTVRDPAESLTVVSLQGYINRPNYTRVGLSKLVALGSRGRIRWVHDGRGKEFWFYDVDPTADGTLFVTAALSNGTTRLFELDPTTGERVWSTTLPYHDTHDADLIDNGSKILLANMRNNVNNRSHDRVVVLDRNGTELWDWQFRTHYPDTVAANVTNDDWTHLNDVERISEGRYLASPRNFDQVVAIDRSSGEILYRLGKDGDFDTLHEQHNPDYIESESGNPTLLVSDSHNNRAVEYALRDGEWERTWAATGVDWPRDADRLPGGNTLIAVSGGHRVVEVTPDGRVVWEVILTGSPYDVERVAFGDESSDVSMADRGETGTVTVHGGSGEPSNARLKACQARLANATRLSTFVDRTDDTGTTPWEGDENGSGAASARSPTRTDSSAAGTGPSPLGVVLGVAVLCLAALAFLARVAR